MSAEPPKTEANARQSFITTAAALEALAQLDRGLGARKPFVLVSGESGSGKTTLVEEAVRRWAGRVTARSIACAEANADRLLATLLGLFGGTARSQASDMALMERLIEVLANGTAGGKVAVLIVDGAEQVTPEALLQLQRVVETAARRQCPLEVLLVGGCGLPARLEDQALAAVAERVSVRVRLEALSQNDTRHYLLQRPGPEGTVGTGMFSRKACRDIHVATMGVPRAIEALADEAARRAARAGATTVSPEHVRAAAQALRSRRGPSPATVIAPRAERLAAAAGGTNQGAARGNGNGAPSPEARAEAPPAENPPASGPAAGAAAPMASVAKAPQPATVATASPSAPETAGSASGEIAFTPSTDPRVKDWVSRFGGSGVGIGVRTAQARLAASAELNDADLGASRRTERATNGVAALEPSSVRETAPAPLPELRPRPSGFSSRRRRQTPTWATAAAVLIFAFLAVVLGQRSGLGKRAAFDAADTSVRPFADSAASTRRRAAAARVVSPAARRTSAAEPTTGQSPSRAHERSSEPSKAPVPAGTHTTRAVAPAPPVPSRVVAPVPQSDAPAKPELSQTDWFQDGLARDERAREEASRNSLQKFGLVVGSYSSRDMAKAEKDHLERLTSYRVWVNSTKVQGVRTYRLVVGRFESMGAAADAGQSMMRRGLIRDANVTPLSGREGR